MGYSPWGRKESDTTERLHFTLICRFISFSSSGHFQPLFLQGSFFFFFFSPAFHKPFVVIPQFLQAVLSFLQYLFFLCLDWILFIDLSSGFLHSAVGSIH